VCSALRGWARDTGDTTLSGMRTAGRMSHGANRRYGLRVTDRFQPGPRGVVYDSARRAVDRTAHVEGSGVDRHALPGAGLAQADEASRCIVGCSNRREEE